MRHWKKKPWVDSEVRNWDYIADHIAPDATSADAGKVLTVGETGKPEWGEGGGSGGGVYMINMDPATLSLDKTWKEIYDNSDKLCVIIYEDGSEDEFVKQFNYIYSLEHSPNGDYVVTCIYYTGQGYAQNILVTDNENDYPHVPEG